MTQTNNSTEIVVRRHNGQCAYGPEIPAEEQRHDLREELADVEGERGIVEVGGQRYEWRRQKA